MQLTFDVHEVHALKGCDAGGQWLAVHRQDVRHSVASQCRKVDSRCEVPCESVTARILVLNTKSVGHLYEFWSGDTFTHECLLLQ